MCILWEEESSSTNRTCSKGLQKASWAGWYPTGKEDQSELPCTSPRAGSHRKFYFLVNAHRAVPCMDVIPLLIAHPAFTEDPYELTWKEHFEGRQGSFNVFWWKEGLQIHRGAATLSHGRKGWLCMCSSKLESAPIPRHCHIPLKHRHCCDPGLSSGSH